MSSLSSCGGGGCTPCTPPQDPPMSSLVLNRILVIIYVTLISNFIEFFLLGNGEGDVMYAEEILQPHLKAFPKVSCSTEIHKSWKEPENIFWSYVRLSLIAPYLILGKSCFPSPGKSALSWSTHMVITCTHEVSTIGLFLHVACHKIETTTGQRSMSPERDFSGHISGMFRAGD